MGRFSVFFTSFFESILSFSFTCWYNSLSVKNKNCLQKIVCICSEITGVSQRHLSQFCEQRMRRKARSTSPKKDHTLHQKWGCFWGRDVAQLIEHRTGTPPMQVRLFGTARDFSPSVNFQCRLSWGVRRPPCVTACVYMCAHVNDPAVHARVRWITETLKHPAWTVRWVARTVAAGFPRGRQPEFPIGEIPLGQYSRKNVFKKHKKEFVTLPSDRRFRHPKCKTDLRILLYLLQSAF